MEEKEDTKEILEEEEVDEEGYSVTRTEHFRSLAIPANEDDVEIRKTEHFRSIQIPESSTVTEPPSGDDDNDDTDDDDDDEKMEDIHDATHSVSWTQQIYWATWKNCLIISRRPMILFVLIFSSIVSTMISWLVGRDSQDEDIILAPLTEGAINDCGMLNDAYMNDLNGEERNNVQITLNEHWRSGIPVSLLSLGPVVNAVIVFLIVQGELSLDLLGILRSLGLRESVYWMSWYLPFAFISLINSLFGAIACKVVPGHVYKSIYFMGFFAGLFLLQLALVPASFFLAAVCGKTNKAFSTLIVVIILFATWIVQITQGTQSLYDDLANYDTRSITWPRGLFWQNLDTSRGTFNNTEGKTTYCDIPLVSEEQGLWYKFEDEREKMEDDEIFIGCYVSASWSATIWGDPSNIANYFLFPFPYYHFMTIFGNFVGYTSLSLEKEFTSEEASLTMEELAIKALPTLPNPGRGGPSELAPQQSTFVTDTYYPYPSPPQGSSTCPLPNKSGYEEYFCGSFPNDCAYVKDPGAILGTPSTYHTYGFLVALSFMYLSLAWYWAQVFPKRNGRAEKFYFFLEPGYWSRTSATTSNETQAGVVITHVRKQYGDFEALKGISFTMAQGEVTALVGENGAGKTTLSSIISCDNAATKGDITVFGYSVVKDPFAVRQMVGLCKQDDYLWPLLTAKEHLELFAGLRGVTSQRRGSMVQKWLQSLDLDIVQSHFPTQYSGGMKRRLSLALATIGDRPLIILDEPTTGMDVVSRRFVWRHIDKIKKNRVILLTTHALDEADLLADEVAIMKNAELEALGSPLELKSDHGTALQFSVVVEKRDLDTTADFIGLFFGNFKDSVTVKVANAGNIDVKILKLRQDEEDDGVPVELLSEFVSWLDSEASKVTEYGFSNSSLEEVFLEVIQGGGGDDGKQMASATASRTSQTFEDDSQVEAGNAGKVNDISSFQPKLQVWNQIRVLHSDFWRRTWIERGTIFQKVWFGVLAIGTLLLGMGIASNPNPTPWFVLVMIFLSFLHISVIASVYSDRYEGQFYLLRTQGLLVESYLMGFSLYSFTVTFLYTLLVLSLLFASPVFREPDLCLRDEDDDYYEEGCYRYSFGEKPIVEPTTVQSYYDVYNGEEVILQAYRSPGGYEYMAVISLVFAVTAIGGALSTAFLPGYKIPMVLITFACIAVCVWPVAEISIMNEEEIEACTKKLAMDSCQGNFSLNNTENLVECVGRDLNSNLNANLCFPPVSAILPQFGFYQGLVMAFQAKVTFVSDPPNYVEEVLMPEIDGKCRGSSCVFPTAYSLFLLNMGFMLIGSVILVVVGLSLARLFVFPSGLFLSLRHFVDNLVNRLCCRKILEVKDDSNDGKFDLDVVTKELQEVVEMVQPFVEDTESKDANVVFHPSKIGDRENVPPVLMHKLRKVYPALGGCPAKVALHSLSLHVAKGQVLGLLGKNGAGKTTALKILSGGHEKSGGLGLVAGFDSELEMNHVFERLGNCAQFDVFWRGRSVKTHLELFAALKGLPRDQISEAAKAVAVAVGLGTDKIYARVSGALSGGMRRRLSIAMSLLGSPSVVILDEPTTGLDPSTRSSIWSLISSFATSERSMIITTHMMLEADVLCSRIAIVSQGKLKVIGTKQYLKDTFGSGYLLQLNLVQSTPENQERAMNFVKRRLHKDAVLRTKQAKTLHINLPRDLKLDDVFQALYSKDRVEEGCINQFLLSQSSLEDVFISLGD